MNFYFKDNYLTVVHNPNVEVLITETGVTERRRVDTIDGSEVYYYDTLFTHYKEEEEVS